MFLMILLIMGPLATTELGTDSWMPDLLQGVGLSASGAGWVFIYVSTLMTILRFYAGPIVHRFSPIGLLVASAAVAVVGLIFLSKASIGLIVVAATVYALGKTFLWSTTLGLVSEQFPKGGALTLNGVSAVGVLGMGIIGTPFMGVLQDREVDKQLAADMPAIHQQVSAPARPSIFGDIFEQRCQCQSAVFDDNILACNCSRCGKVFGMIQVWYTNTVPNTIKSLTIVCGLSYLLLYMSL